MRTYSESFNVAADNDDLRNRNFSYNNYNNNNNNVIKSNGYGGGGGGVGSGGGAIPYHARENSLPFSYGQIGKTSTPLKSVTSNSATGGGTSGYGNDSTYLSGIVDGNGIDANYGLNGRGNSSSGGGGGVGGGAYKNAIDISRKPGNDSDTDASMIKTQPRLKSPLLVRKTLNSHSPTRGGGTNGTNGTTNTISNTYHYSYGNANGGNGSGNGYGYGTGRQSPSVNGNGGLYGNFYGTNTRQRTPTRSDFEDLLRERREKVFNEYRDTATATTTTSATNVLPPPRQFRSEDTTDAVYATPRHRKYNYDFEFHLNLDEDWPVGQMPLGGSKVPPQPPVRRTSSNALEQYNSSNTFGKREQLQRDQYRTRDIELPPLAPRDFERNYHTLSTTGAPYKEPYYGRDASTERYFETYEQRRQQTQSMPQPQRQQLQPQSMQQQQRTEYSATTTYGNGNSSGYGYNTSNNNNNIANNNNIYRNHNINNVTGSAVYRSQLDSAAKPASAISPVSTASSMPIYATTTKQVMKSSAYRNEPTMQATLTDYHSSVNMASPTSAATPTTPLFSRPETPAFPVTPRTPFGTIQNGYSPNGRRLDHSISNGSQQYSSETIYQLTSPRSRLNSGFSVATTNAEPQEVAAHLVKFAKDSSKFWYKPNLSRDEAISLLLNAAPGTFLVRDSTTYKNAYGLVLRVAQLPPNSNGTGKPDELVRHFLIEPTTRGVRLKGCPNEPVFTSLSALVYEHSINQLALPCLLRIPDEDLVPPLIEPTPAQKQLLAQGAACNVLWLYSCDTESLTGEEAIRKAIRQLYAQKPVPTPTEVHFKVSQQGITLTDNTRKKFFRKHYAADMISFCAIDPDHRLWTMPEPTLEGAEKASSTTTPATVGVMKKTIFAFVARRSPSSKDNQCHVFCDLAVNQPASAIVSFANKTLPTDRQRNYVL